MDFRVKRTRSVPAGCISLLTCAGIDGVVAAEARKQAAKKEKWRRTPYVVEKTSSTGRAVYVAHPEGEGRVPNLDHETWVNEVWPRVGGPKWRPHR